MRIFAICLLWFLVMFSFSQEPGMKNFTTQDGLPSDEVYRSLIDSEGYLWFSTNDGVCRFDGKIFKIFEQKDGLSENTILDLEMDSKGRVWFGGISGKLSYYDHGKIYPFSGNDIILKNKLTVELITTGSIYPIDTNEVQFTLTSGKSFHVKNNQAKICDVKKGDSLPISKGNNLYKFYYNRTDSTDIYSVIFDSICYKVPVKTTNLSRYQNYYLYQEFDDRILYLQGNRAITIYKNGDSKVDLLNFSPRYSIKGIYGGIWIGTYKNGVMFFDDFDFSKPARINFLPGQYITSLNYDQNTRGWVTTSSGGVYYVQSLYITNYLNENHSHKNYLSKIVKIDSNTFAFFSRNNKIYITNDFSKPMQEIPLEELNNYLVYQIRVFGNKVFVSTSDCFLEIPIEFFTNPKHPKKGIIKYENNNIKDFIFQDSILWIAKNNGIYCERHFLKDKILTTERSKNIIHSRFSKINKSPSFGNDSLYSYMLAQEIDTLWRIRYSKNNPYVIHKSFLLRKIIVKDILTNPNNNLIYLGTIGNGLEIISGDSVMVFNTESGLLANKVNVIKLQDDTTVILGTNKGINILTFSNETYPKLKSSKIITQNDGLSGNEIHDIEFYKRHYIITTNKGISLIEPNTVLNMQDHFPIYITDFIVNGGKRDLGDEIPLILAFNENHIQINYDAIDFHDKKNIRYFYKLDGSTNADWTEIAESSVTFPYLPSGKYSFRVKAMNSYGYLSQNISNVDFIIKEVFYKTTWFRSLITILLLLLVVSVIYTFFKRKTEKLVTKNTLAEYHQQSLARALNPHFIFNALNSVNSLIITDRKKDATFYITQIASFIREIFNHAAYNKIKILQETEMLSNYLKIEQRRIPYHFNFIIKIHDDLDNFDIPSFMVQIFVENAIWHGFGDKKLKGALVYISFYKKDEHIICKIIDNGIGRKAASEIITKKQKSRDLHGIDVINERIRLLNLKYSDQRISLIIEDKLNLTKNTPIGTIVKLKFPIITNSK